MSFMIQLYWKVGDLVNGKRSEICADLNPRQTLPGQNNVLLLQPQGGFSFVIEPSSEKKYSGEIRFEVPDPFEIRNQSRPSLAEWDYEEQKLQINELDKQSEILMKAALPEKFRGETSARICAVDCSKNMTIATLPIKSDPPVSST